MQPGRPGGHRWQWAVVLLCGQLDKERSTVTLDVGSRLGHSPIAEPPHLAASPPDILTCMAEWQRVWSDQTFMTTAFKHFGFSWPMVPQIDPAQQPPRLDTATGRLSGAGWFPRGAALAFQQRSEESSGGVSIASRLHEDVDHVAVLVHGVPDCTLEGRLR